MGCTWTVWSLLSAVMAHAAASTVRRARRFSCSTEVVLARGRRQRMPFESSQAKAGRPSAGAADLICADPGEPHCGCTVASPATRRIFLIEIIPGLDCCARITPAERRLTAHGTQQIEAEPCQRS
jgi:hypothetical protein